jgi:hypothetical protein
MPLPSEQEYVRMLGRLQDVMQYAAEELEQVANGVTPGLSQACADEITTRLRSLVRNVFFRIANNEIDPLPEDLPTIANTPTPDACSSERP